MSLNYIHSFNGPCIKTAVMNKFIILLSLSLSLRLAQRQMQEQNVADALRESQKPLARHIDDEDLDKMLREQEREGDPMAALLRKKKEKNAQTKGIKGED